MPSVPEVFEGPLGPAVFRIVRGSPSAEELAALTALLTSLAATDSDDGAPPARAAVWRRPELFPPVSWRARGSAATR
ncbi:acyl-CoA carboxylase subunit epsilon [Streptomyces sp. NPDC005930]|uniref:acyl-CoA carboxylase subunit epsilon n=1 Tax=Streptomyces sp. NPDC005930 TaxID=3364736 RepID=UPI0036C9AC07